MSRGELKKNQQLKPTSGSKSSLIKLIDLLGKTSDSKFHKTVKVPLVVNKRFI